VAGCVVPPSLFTDGLPLVTLPWELQDVSCGFRGKCVDPIASHSPGFALPNNDLELEVIWALGEGTGGAEIAATKITSIDTNITSIEPVVRVALDLGSHRGATAVAGRAVWNGSPGEVLVLLGSTRFDFSGQ